MEEDNINGIFFADGLSLIIFSPFNSIFFYFMIIMFVVHKNNIHTNSIRILTIHFVLRVIGDSINKARFLIMNDDDYIYRNRPVWNILFCAYVFWYSGEIVGDFYLLSRTTPFILSPFKNIRLILSYVTYILLALMKITLMMYHFFYPYHKILRKYSDQYYDYWNKFWTIQLFISLLSLIYDIIIYFTMKVDFFDKDIFYEVKDNNAWKRYRKMSRIRVKYVAIVAAITVIFVLFSKIKYLESVLSYSYLEYYRTILVTMPYIMMYIDQILISETDLIPINESIVHMNLYSHFLNNK